MRHRRRPRPSAALLAALGAALLAGGLPAAAGDAVGPERLRRDLEQGARLFRRNPDDASAAAYAARLSWVDVEWEGGTITVRDPWLSDAASSLDRLSPELRKRQIERIAEHLSARATQVDRLDEAAPAPSAAAGVTPAPAPEALLQEILDQPHFRAPPEDPKLAQAASRLRDAVRAAWRQAKDFLSEVFAPRQDGGRWQALKRVGLMVLAVLGIVLLGWLAARALLRAAVDTASEAPETEMPEAPPVPAEMAAVARARASTGDHRGAIRALYLALLGDLHRQGVIAYDRHRTNREYLRAMRAGAARKSAFQALVEVFDRKWYGKEPCTREEVEAFERGVSRAGDPAIEHRERAA